MKKYFKYLIGVSLLAFIGFPAILSYAQVTAQQMQPGYLSTSGCPGSQFSCFLPYTATAPLPIGIYPATATAGYVLTSNGPGLLATFQASTGTGGGGSSTLGGAVGTPIPYSTLDATTGFYSDTATSVSIAITGTNAFTFSSTGFTLNGSTGLYMPSQDTEDGSLAIGEGALTGISASSGAYRAIAIGKRALNNGPGGGTVIAIGYQSMPFLTTGHNNYAFGFNTGGALTTGNFNNFFGNDAGAKITTGGGNTCIGEGVCFIFDTGTENTMVGDLAGSIISGSSSFNVAIGSFALNPDAQVSSNTAIGYQAMTKSGGQHNVAIGAQAMGRTATGAAAFYNTCGGDSCLKNLSGSQTGNTAFGGLTGTNVSTGARNTILGYNVGSTTLTTGSNNILIGTTATVDTTASNSSNQLNIGAVIYGTSMNNNAGKIGINNNAPGVTLDLSSNTDAAALPSGTTAQRPGGALPYIRYNSDGDAIEGYFPTAGTWKNLANTGTGGTVTSVAMTLSGLTGMSVTGTPIVGAGTLAISGTLGASATDNTSYLIGSGALSSLTATNAHSVAIGNNAAQNMTVGINDIAIGYLVLQNATGGQARTAVGYQSMQSATSGSSFSSSFGGQTLVNVAGNNNAAFGYGAGQFVSNGSGNSLFGVNAGGFITNGVDNVAVGRNAIAGLTASRITAGGNTAVGTLALSGLITTGATNTAVGYSAGSKITTGTSNVVIGPNVASLTLTTGTGNILIGNSSAIDVTASGTSNTFILGNSATPVIISTGINATPGTTLNGPISMPGLATSSAAQTGTVCSGAGGLLTVDTTTTCLLSLEELKDIAGPITNASDMVMRLDPFWFNWKKTTPEWSGDKAQQPGLGANQVAGVDQRLAAYNPDGTLKGVRYQELTAVLVAAFKEQHQRVDTMERDLQHIPNIGVKTTFWQRLKWLVGG